MRHARLASSLLIMGGAIACGPLLAQQAAIDTPPPAEPVPTASVTIVAPAEPEPAPAAGDVPAVQPTASVTLVEAVPAQPVPTTIATGVPTTIATGVPTTTATGVPTTVATGIPASTTVVPAPATGVTPAATATVPAAGTATPAAGAIIDPATYQKRTEFDNTPYRFNMEQNGRRMTADEFTAWMEARGVRVARGPAAHRPANPTSDGMPAQGSAMPVGVAPVTMQVSTPAPAVVAPQPTAPAVQAMPATTTVPVTTSVLHASPTASATVVGPAPPAGVGLAPGSVTPSDAWKGVDPVPAPTSTATIVVPVEATEPPPEGEQAN